MEDRGGMFLNCDIEAHDTHTDGGRKVPNVRGADSVAEKKGRIGYAPYHQKREAQAK